jgi:uncharacterized membrane protein
VTGTSTAHGTDRALPARTGHHSSRRRAGIAALAGAAAAGVGYLARVPDLAPVIGWLVAGLTFLVWTWTKVWPKDADETARIAVAEDPTRPIADALVLFAAVAAMLAVALVVIRGAGEPVRLGLGLFAIVVSWAVLHTVFTLTYARLYYTGVDGGIGFNQDARPRYSDFAYVAFTVGMTFQVSDTNLTSTEMRRACLRHAWLSYLFGAVILAVTINIVAGKVG